MDIKESNFESIRNMSDEELNYLCSIQDAINDEYKTRFLNKYNIDDLKVGDVLKIESNDYFNSTSIIKILKIENLNVEYKRVWYIGNSIADTDECKGNFETLIIGVFEDSKTVTRLHNFDFDNLYNGLTSARNIYLNNIKELLDLFHLL